MASIQPKTITARTGEEVVIRTAQPDDAAAMLAYIHCIGSEPELTVLEPDEFPATKEKERQWVQDHLDHPGKIVLVAESSVTIIGGLSFENGANRRTAHRGSFGISLLKEWRGRGVGTAMLETLLEWATATTRSLKRSAWMSLPRTTGRSGSTRGWVS
jgi:RimJ/RimL family protein N-acetyltransferase